MKKPIRLVCLPGVPGSEVMSVLRKHADVAGDIIYGPFDPKQHRKDCTYLYLYDETEQALRRILTSLEQPEQQSLASKLTSVLRPKGEADIGWMEAYPKWNEKPRSEIVASILSDPESEIGFAHHFKTWQRAKRKRDLISLHGDVWREYLPTILGALGGKTPSQISARSNPSKSIALPVGTPPLEPLPKIPDAIRWPSSDQSVDVFSRTPLSLFPARHWGMFAVVNCVVNAAKRYDDGQLPPFTIDSENFLYGRWEDFFEPPFDIDPPRGRLNMSLFGREFMKPVGHPPSEDMAEYTRIFQPKEKTSLLLPPLDRVEAQRIIARYVRLVPELATSIKTEIDSSGVREMIGVHVRGPGRLDGGTGFMRWKMGYEDVPYVEYYKLIDEELEREDRDLFVFSDASESIDAFRDRYGRRVHCRDASFLWKDGEAHMFEGTPKAQLARDILTETWMMAATRRLIHGNSNVSNFVLCLSPDLEATDVYQRFY